MKILITGGGGFIGSNIANHLALKGHSVYVLDAEYVDCGFNERNLLKNGNILYIPAKLGSTSQYHHILSDIDNVIHCSGQTGHAASMSNPHADIESNLTDPVSFFEALFAVNNKCQVVNLSTRQLYGRTKGLVNETHIINPPDINGINKLAFEHYLQLKSRIYNINCINLRLSNIYGPRIRIKDAKQTFVGFWIKGALLNKSIAIWGNPELLRDLLYIKDLLELIEIMLDRFPTGFNTYNVGHSESLQLNEIAEQLRALVHDLRITHEPMPKISQAISIGDFQGDYKKIQSAFNWLPKIGLLEGLEATLDYYKDNMDFYL